MLSKHTQQRRPPLQTLLQTRLAVRGIRKIGHFCGEQGVAHDICGKVVVTTTKAEANRLRDLEIREQNLMPSRWRVGFDWYRGFKG
jgi:hypothetical protein